MERETQKYQTPSGKEFVLVTFLNAREVRSIENAVASQVKIDYKEEEAGPGGQIARKPVIKDYDTQAALTATDDALIIRAVVSFDGSSENILDRILEGSSADYKFILLKARDLIVDPTSAK